MLVSFSVANYRSFGEEVTLNMVANNRLTNHLHHRVEIPGTDRFAVRAALIYGANAAGKSNLVKAMSFAQSLIGWRQHERPTVDNFRFQPDAARKPSSFEFRFLVGNRVFIYGFDLLLDKIASEWLSVLKGDDEVEIFSRAEDGTASVGKGVELFPDDCRVAETLGVLSRLRIRKDQLFLNRVSSMPEDVQGETLRSVLRWLTNDLQILETEHRSCDILDRLNSDPDFKSFAARFFDSVDTGIRNLAFEETERECSEWERDYIGHFEDHEEVPYAMFGCTGDTDVRLKPGDPNRLIVRRLLAQHTAGAAMGTEEKFSLPFCEESDGTQQLLHYMPLLATPKNETKVYVIDELDRSLHPLLCREFIRFFSDSCPGARKQLIVTTHEAHLLDQELLRRDEYWFVEKDRRQQSQLVPLSEFQIRNDLKVRKGYLHGRFGAIPIFGGLGEVRKLLDCQDRETSDAPQEAAT